MLKDELRKRRSDLMRQMDAIDVLLNEIDGTAAEAATKAQPDVATHRTGREIVLEYLSANPHSPRGEIVAGSGVHGSHVDKLLAEMMDQKLVERVKPVGGGVFRYSVTKKGKR